MTHAFEIDHVQIAIPTGGEDEARRFYAGALGLTELPKPAPVAARGGCWFALGARQLHLGIDADFRPGIKSHVALTTGDMDGLEADLRAAGFEVIPDVAVNGRRRFYAADPFGNRVEFIESAA